MIVFSTDSLVCRLIHLLFHNFPSVCMYVCMSEIYIRRALSRKVTVAPRSQTNRNVFSVRLNRSVDKSAERREDGRLFQILAPATAKLRSPNVLLVRRTTNIAVSDDRSVRQPESAMSWQSSARYGGSWPSSDLYGSAAPAWTLRVVGPAANGADEVDKLASAFAIWEISFLRSSQCHKWQCYPGV